MLDKNLRVWYKGGMRMREGRTRKAAEMETKKSWSPKRQELFPSLFVFLLFVW